MYQNGFSLCNLSVTERLSLKLSSFLCGTLSISLAVDNAHVDNIRQSNEYVIANDVYLLSFWSLNEVYFLGN